MFIGLNNKNTFICYTCVIYKYPFDFENEVKWIWSGARFKLFIKHVTEICVKIKHIISFMALYVLFDYRFISLWFHVKRWLLVWMIAYAWHRFKFPHGYDCIILSNRYIPTIIWSTLTYEIRQITILILTKSKMNNTISNIHIIILNWTGLHKIETHFHYEIALKDGKYQIFYQLIKKLT